MKFIITSQGATGSASLSRALNRIPSVYVAHGHYTLLKDYEKPEYYSGEDTSHLLGHELKGIYQSLTLKEIFDYFSEIFPWSRDQGLIHTFTLGSFESRIDEIAAVGEMMIVNLIRDPFDVYFSSKNLVKKSLLSSTPGRKEYLSQYHTLLESESLLIPLAVEIEANNSLLDAVSVLVSAGAVQSMLKETQAYQHLAKSYKIEEIMNNHSSLINFAQVLLRRDDIHFGEETNNLLLKVNSHHIQSTDTFDGKVFSLQERLIFEYFVDDQCRKQWAKYYPDSYEVCFKDRIEPSQAIFSEEKIGNGSILRGLEKSVGYHLATANLEQSIPFLTAKLNGLLSQVRQYLIQLETEPEPESFQQVNVDEIPFKDRRVGLVPIPKKNNLLKIGDAFYMVPHSLGAIDPSQFKTEDEFLQAHPSVKRI